MSYVPPLERWPRIRQAFSINGSSSSPATMFTCGVAQAAYVLEGVDFVIPSGNTGQILTLSVHQGSNVFPFWQFVLTGNPTYQGWRGEMALTNPMILQCNFVGTINWAAWGYMEPWQNPLVFGPF